MTLAGALAAAVADVPLSITEAGANEVSDSIVLDDRTVSSEILITGEYDATLQPPADSAPLLTIKAGAPPVRLRDLTLPLGGIVRVEGSSVDIEGCTFVGSSASGGALAADGDGAGGRRLTTASADRAVSVHGGHVIIRRANFSHTAGAILLLTAGTPHVSDSVVHGCRAAQGAAMLVTGGAGIVDRSVFEGNEASVSGGAVQVDGGRVTLREYTHLRGNRAPIGRSI